MSDQNPEEVKKAVEGEVPAAEETTIEVAPEEVAPATEETPAEAEVATPEATA